MKKKRKKRKRKWQTGRNRVTNDEGVEEKADKKGGRRGRK